MSDFVAQEPQEAPKSLSDDQLHAALLDAYRHLADQAPRGSTLLLPAEHRWHRGQVAMVMAAAVAAIAIPTVVITQIARPGGSILPGGPATVSTPVPAPFTGSLTTTPPATKTVHPTPMATVVQASPPGTATVVRVSPPGTATVVRVSTPATATLAVATTPAAASTESGSSTRTYSPMTGSDSWSTVQRAPFRVGYLPAGYRYRGAQSQTDKDGAPGTITLVHTKADSATICVSLYRYDQHSWNWDSQAKSVEVNGLPARVTDGMVMIRYGSALITVFAKQREGSGELLAVARGLSLAKDPADESTWFAIARAAG